MSEHWAPIKHQQHGSTGSAHGSTTLHSPRRISRYEMIANGEACQDPAGRPCQDSLGNIAPASKRGKKNMVIQPRSLTVTLVILSPQLSMIPIAAGWRKELGWTNRKHPAGMIQRPCASSTADTEVSSLCASSVVPFHDAVLTCAGLTCGWG